MKHATINSVVSVNMAAEYMNIVMRPFYGAALSVALHPSLRPSHASDCRSFYVFPISLSIVGGNTSCTTNLSASEAVQENNVITMTCTITYSGNWAPVMTWFNSVTSRDFTDEVITVTTNETVTSQLTVTSSAGLHGSKIVCVTNFSQLSPPLSTNATNIPSYMYTWTSPILNIQCKCSITALCLYACLFVCHDPLLYQNG